MCIVQKKRERERRILNGNKTFLKKRKVELMNNTQLDTFAYATQMTSTRNRNRSSDDVVENTKDISLEQQEEKNKDEEEEENPMIVVLFLFFERT